MNSIGRFEILGKLGQGAFGMVYRGRDPKINRVVAIKVMAETFAGDPAQLARFKREAEAAGGLNHRNIVTIYELGEHEGQPFIAMEYLEGQDLASVLARNIDLPLEQRLDIVIQIAEGLHYAHERGVVHRDVKPANIRLLEDGTAKIMDFGIARTSGSNMTNTGLVLGTVNYMAPEMLQGKAIDRQADQFSLGVTAYEILDRRRPFPGDNISAVLYGIVHNTPEPLREIRATPYAAVDRVIQRCLEKDPALRWPSCQALAQALREQVIPRTASMVLPIPADIEGTATQHLDVAAVSRATSRQGLASSTVVSAIGAPPAASPSTTAITLTSAGARRTAALAGGAIALVALAGFVGYSVRRSPPIVASVPQAPVAPPVSPTPPVLAVAPSEETGDRGEAAALDTPAAAPPEAATPVAPPAAAVPSPAAVAPTPAGPGPSAVAPDRERRKSIDALAGEIRPLLRAETLDRTRITRQLEALRRLDPAAPLLGEGERLLAGVARASDALAELAPDAAVAALRGLDPGVPAVRALGAKAQEQTHRRDRAQADLALARTALEGGRTDEALRLARQASVAWPPLADEVERMATAAAAKAAAAAAVLPATPAAVPSTPTTAAPPATPTPLADKHGDDRSAIEQLLSRYSSALRSKDIAALRRAWPTLPADREKTIASSFRFAKEHVVELKVVDLKLGPDTATVSCERRDRIETNDGQVVANETRAVFELRRTGGSWVIADLR